jgi:hypothetical protein
LTAEYFIVLAKDKYLDRGEVWGGRQKGMGEKWFLEGH